ncbi:hypothetical protein BDA99DRAFT_539406 [Phascolomyces articulosus]|uniref:Uncharacterized protein n=1 Tax=Phascolomyces articulosus TaxID=60185 RepID=A0AAD5JW42_9FUNG|nr:hypothetical protein BDA99DRAFT_539406 [Phascolomyces articulosus]
MDHFKAPKLSRVQCGWVFFKYGRLKDKMNDLIILMNLNIIKKKWRVNHDYQAISLYSSTSTADSSYFRLLHSRFLQLLRELSEKHNDHAPCNLQLDFVGVIRYHYSSLCRIKYIISTHSYFNLVHGIYNQLVGYTHGSIHRKTSTISSNGYEENIKPNIVLFYAYRHTMTMNSINPLQNLNHKNEK